MELHDQLGERGEGARSRRRGLVAPRLGGVAYLNARPVLHGLLSERPPSLSLDVPSVLARGLAAGTLDAALAPVATLGLAADLELAPDICIGCDGEVRSVLILSERPLRELRALILDSHSRTSVVLARLVAAELRGGKSLDCIPGDHLRMRRDARGDVGAVVIGDEALRMRRRYPHVLDLGEAWKRWTGLPFVFAAWIARPGTLGPFTVARLRASLEQGLIARPDIAAQWAREHGGDARQHLRYLESNIHFRLDGRHEAGLREFLGRAAAAELLPDVELRFAGAGRGA